MKYTKLIRTSQVLLTVLVILSQFSAPLAAMARTLEENHLAATSVAKTATAETTRTETISPTLAELDAQFLDMVQTYIRTPEDATPTERFQQGYAFAQALYTYAFQYELSQEAMSRRTRLPIRGLSIEHMNKAFMRLLEDYFAIPGDISIAERTRYEDTFAIGFEVLTIQSERVTSVEEDKDAPPQSPPEGGKIVDTESVHSPPLEGNMQADTEPIHSPPLEGNIAGTEPMQSPPLGGNIGGERVWTLESNNPDTGQEANWLISAGSESLSAFEAAFTKAMNNSSQSTTGTPTNSGQKSTTAAGKQSQAVTNPQPAPQPAAIPKTPAITVPKTSSTAPADSPPSARLNRESGIVGFDYHSITTGSSRPNDVYVADINNDGHIDVLAISVAYDTLYWYENDGANPPSFASHTIATLPDKDPQALYAIDVDGDGDTDVLAAFRFDGKIVWYENNNKGQSFTTHTITTNASYATSVHAADIDGDGDIDVFSSSYNNDEIGWYKNNGNKTFTEQTPLSTDTTAVYAIDLDQDGHMDILSAGYNTITWYKNDGSAASFTKNIINGTAKGGTAIYATDMDRDGDIDVLTASYINNTIAWYENDGSELFTLHTITDAAANAQDVYAADLDYDGDMDILSASEDDDTIAWYENNGSQVFTAHDIATDADGAKAVYAADINGDGHLDVLSASYNDGTIAWYDNRDPHYSTTYPSQATVASAGGAQSVYVIDVNGDGALDVVSAGYDNTVVWHENNGSQSFTSHTITDQAISASSVYATDVDSDGDIDVLSAAYNNNQIAWYENNGSESFTPHTITSNASGATSVYATDMDGDGDIDVLSASWEDGKIAWYRNNGSESFSEQTITTGAGGANSVYAADVNRDGKMDVLSASDNGVVAWYDGNNSFSQQIIYQDIFGMEKPKSVYATDIDGDGDIDVLAAITNVGITWYENNGSQSFSAHTIGSGSGEKSVYAADVDRDGDIDVLAAFSDNNKITWYENNGSQSFSAHTITTNASFATAVHAADLDSDGDIDILSASRDDSKIAWYENQGWQAMLTATATAPATLENDQEDDIFRIVVSHLGKSGDNNIELADLRLRFTTPSDVPLTTEQVNAVISHLRIYLDTGSGTFEVENDTLVRTIDELSLSDGYYTKDMNVLDDPNIETPPGTSKTFFVVLDLTPDANTQGVHDFKFTYIAEGTDSSSVEVSDYYITPVTKSASNVSTQASLNTDWSRTTGNPGLSGGDVNAIVTSGTDIYAGGSFTGKVAHWNGSSWDTLGNLDGNVYSLVISGTTLYAGGSFTGNLARWNGSTWEGISGLNNTVYALAATGDALYVGGDFTGAGAVTGADYIARWKNDTWYTLGTGADGTVNAITIHDTGIYIGGSFTTPDLAVARWDGNAWHSLNGGFLGSVLALASVGQDIYAGGDFTGNLARWDGSTWQVIGKTPVFNEHPITTGLDGARSGYAADMDGDGDTDILAAALFDDLVVWYENDGATPPSFTEHTIATGINGAYSVYAADVDGDGDMDAVSSASTFGNDITWYKNDGSQNFTPYTIDTVSGGRSVYATDINNDGAMDILATSNLDDRVIWYANDGSQNFTANTITSSADGANSVYAADVDGDGDMDVLSASTLDDKIAWYQNDGDGNFTAHTITSNADGANSVSAADVDGDGDIDVLSASVNDDKIAWYENDGATVPGFTPHTVTTAADAAQAVYATDVDGDGDMDILSASRDDDQIAWYENNGNATPDFIPHTITTAADAALSVYAADIDGDGDIDVISASTYDDKVAWYENTQPASDLNGSTPLVKALAASGSDLYVGGVFAGAGGIPTANVARWNGFQWSALESGTEGTVNALTVGNNGPLVGGTFTAVNGDILSNKVASWEPSFVNLALGHTVTPTTTAAGGTLTYTLYITNNGSSTATGVRVYDRLPESLALLSYSQECEATGNTLRCYLADMAPGATINLRAVVTTPIASNSYHNTAFVSANQPDSNSTDNVVSAPPVTVTIQSDLELSKSAPSSVVAGRNLTYTLTITNHGQNIATNAVLVDNLPAGLTILSTTSGCTGESGSISCALGDMPVGATKTVTLTTTVPADIGPGILTNTASITSDAVDPVTNNNTAQAETAVTVEAGLAVGILVPETVCISGTLYTTLIVSNTGPSQATGVSLTTPLPNGAIFKSTSPACTHDNNIPGQVVCGVGDLAVGANRTYTVAVTLSGLDDFAILNHTVNATATSPDPIPGDNNASTTTTVRTDCSELQADLSLTKIAPATIPAGGFITYTLTVKNNGSRDATGINISDTLPTEVSFEEAYSSPNCTAADDIVCTVAKLGTGDSRSYTVIGQVAVDTVPGTQLTNTATVNASEPDFFPENNRDNVASTVVLSSDIAIAKTAPLTASTGTSMAYTLTVTNNGPSHATGVIMTDTLPGEVLYDGVTVGQGACSETGGVIVCDIGVLNAGASTMVYITVTPFQGGGLLNTAYATATPPDPDIGNNSDTATTIIAAGAGRETRAYGYLRVTANAFINLGGEEVQALGDIWLGAEGGEAEDPIMLADDEDVLTINTTTNEATGNGTVTVRNGDARLFKGDFTINGTLTTPLVIPGSNLTYTFDALADFKVDAGMTLTDTNLSTGGTRGYAKLAVQSPGLDKTLDADFEVLPGPEYIATLEAFDFIVAGCSVTVTAPKLGNTGIGADEVIMTLPESLGKTSANLNDLLITPDSLSFGNVGATFPLPDIKFGKGDKVKIVDTEARLLYLKQSNSFALTAAGSLSLTMPSNQQTIAIQLRVDTEGNLSARLDQMSMKVAGSTLQMRDILINNSGLAVSAAILTLPPSFKGAEATLSNITITGDGLHIGAAGATFPLPDLKIGNGSKVKFTELRATLEIEDLTDDPAYTFGIQGVLNLRLPQNAQDIRFTAELNGAGEFSGTLDQLSLTMAGGKANLQLETIAFDNSGLDVKTGTLTLSLGSTPVTGTVTALRIDDNGLSVGGGSVTVAIPDIKVGSGKNFSLTGATVTLELGGDRSYKLTLAGTMKITIPGANASATASISLDGDGNISGTIQSFSLTVAGLGLAIDNAVLKDGMLLVDKAAFEIPPAWGGLKAELYQLRIGGPGGLSIGGGKFTLPDMKVGKITLAGLEGGFVPVDGGYEITAKGMFKVPALGGGPNCGIKVGVTLYAKSGRTVMAIHTLEPPDNFGRPAGLAQQTEYFRQPEAHLQPSLSSLALKHVTCGLEGCRIPIATTGFFLSRVEGALTLDQGTTHIDLGVTIITGFGLGTIPAVAGDADLGLDFDPFQIDFTGAVTLFSIFKAAELEAEMRSGFFSAELRINQIWPPFRGEAGLTAWTKDGSFHLVGHASLTVGFKKGQLWHTCVDLLLRTVCVNVPPCNTNFGGIHTEFGEFQKGNDTTWGIKGWVGVYIPWPVKEHINIGFYFDATGKLKIGNVNGYQTITPPSVASARQLWMAQRTGRLMAMTLTEEERDLLDNYHFDIRTPDVVETDVTIATRSDVLFYMVRTSTTPTMALIDPAGTVITPDNLPDNIGYEEIQVTQTITLPIPGIVTDTQVMYGVKDAEPGTWRVRLTGEPEAGEGYIVDVLGVVPQPVLSNLGATNTGPTTAEATWSLNSTQPTTTLSIYATPGPISTTFTVTNTQGIPGTTNEPLFTGYPIAVSLPTQLDGTLQSATLDLSKLESGTYYVWFDANDDRNPPIRAYAPTTLTVSHPWQYTWTAGLQAETGFRELGLHWNASPHPDVDGYTVYLSTEPVVPMSGQAIEVGDLLSTTLYGLTPDQTYYLTLGAVDEDTGRIALSESITATPQSAPFALSTATTGFSLNSGDTLDFMLHITTSLPIYPGVVGLYTDNLPDGIAITLSNDIVTPTVDGIDIGATLSTTTRLPGGVYTATLTATGPGEKTSLPLIITVQESTFTLIAPPTVTLTEAASTALNITASRSITESTDKNDAPIYLSLDGTPTGLLAGWNRRTITSGTTATLHITDTALLNNGVYTLTLTGENGKNTDTVPVVLNVTKPGFSLSTTQPRRIALHGETITYTLNLNSYFWPYPVQVALDNSSTIPGCEMGFQVTPEDTLNTAITVTAPAQIFLVTQVTSATLAGQYLPTVVASSQTKQAILDLELMVYKAATSADLEIVQPATIDAIAGTTYVYTATLTNYGPLEATDVTLTYTLPAHWVTLVQATPSQWHCDTANDKVLCTLGNLARDGQANIRFELVLDPSTPDGTQITNQTYASTTQTEENTLDNTGVTLATVDTQAQLALNTQTIPDPAIIGSDLVYYLTLANHGPSDASGVQLHSNLPGGTDFRSASPDCTHTLGTVVCALDHLDMGTSTAITIATTLHQSKPGNLSSSVSALADNGVTQPQTTIVVTLVDQLIGDLLATHSGYTRLGDTTVFTATTATGTNINYKWDFGDGTPPQTGEKVIHTYPNVGDYTVILTATNTAYPSGVATTTKAIVYADYAWNGSSGTLWDTAHNWTPYTGYPPTQNDNVTLPGNQNRHIWPTIERTMVVNHLNLESGTELTLLDGGDLQIDGTLSNYGTLRQTTNSLRANTTAQFLHLQNAAGTLDQYAGVDIEPEADMGPVTVAVTGHALCPQATGKTVQRCYNVIAEGSATLTFYYRESERNGLDAATMHLWHRNTAIEQWEMVNPDTTTRDSTEAYHTVTVSGITNYGQFTLRPGNIPPVAGDNVYTVGKDSNTTLLDVLAGDTDADGDSLYIYDIGPNSHGGTLFNNKTAITYTPAPGFLGTDTFTYTASDGFNGFDTAQVTVTVAAHTFYLPLVLRRSVTAPDLVVENITATTDTIEVTIKNQGNAPVETADEFFLEVYIAPATAPTEVNQLWYDLGNAGMFWNITSELLPLAPGETLTLKAGDVFYMVAYSRVTWPLEAGIPVYAQVDAYNAGTTYGAVQEIHEISGDVYNNISGPVYVGEGK